MYAFVPREFQTPAFLKLILPPHLTGVARMATLSLPQTMKVVHQPDPKSTNLVLEDGPLPKPSHPEDYLIRVHTASPCPGELHWEVNFPSVFTPGRERVPCTEAAGVIVQAPPQSGAPPAARSSQFKVGDEVFFRLDPAMTGNLRQYTLARLANMAHKPKNVGWVEAGATPLSALTAWQAIFQHGILDSKAMFGDAEAIKKNASAKILITGAAGVVGGWAVQFAAKAAAGQVIASTSGSTADYVRGLGATAVIDYKKQSLKDWVAENPSERQVDAIFDCVGGPSLGDCWYAVKEQGVLLSVTGDPASARPDLVNKTLSTAKWFLVEPNGSQLEVIAKLLENASCVTKVDSVVEFADFQAAFDKVEQRKANGKVVIKVSDLA